MTDVPLGLHYLAPQAAKSEMYQRTFWVETSGRSVAAALGPWLLTDARGGRAELREVLTPEDRPRLLSGGRCVADVVCVGNRGSLGVYGPASVARSLNCPFPCAAELPARVVAMDSALLHSPGGAD